MTRKLGGKLGAGKNPQNLFQGLTVRKNQVAICLYTTNLFNNWLHQLLVEAKFDSKPTVIFILSLKKKKGIPICLKNDGE